MAFTITIKDHTTGEEKMLNAEGFLLMQVRERKEEHFIGEMFSGDITFEETVRLMQRAFRTFKPEEDVEEVGGVQ